MGLRSWTQTAQKLGICTLRADGCNDLPALDWCPCCVSFCVVRRGSRGHYLQVGASLEALGRASMVVFDKTGTLTTGKPHVVDCVRVGGANTKTVLGLVHALEYHFCSVHILASAICAYAERNDAAAVGGVVESSLGVAPGMGVYGIIEKKGIKTQSYVCVGSKMLMQERGVRGLERLENVDARENTIPVYAAVDGVLECVLLIADEIRQGIRELVSRLQCRVAILSGDRSRRLARVARTRRS